MKTMLTLDNSIADQYPLATFVTAVVMSAAVLGTVIAVIGCAVAHPDPARRRAAQQTLRIIADLVASIFDRR